MTIQLAIAPEQEVRLAEVAAAKGMRPAEYVGELVADALAWERPVGSGVPKEDIHDFLDRLASIAKPVNVLTTETFSREMLYADDDKFPV